MRDGSALPKIAAIIRRGVGLSANPAGFVIARAALAALVRPDGSLAAR